MISVIIPIYNRKANLRRVLAALDRQDLPKSQFEVIVSDDGSSDDPVEVLREYEKILELKYRWQPNKGFRAPIARNEGVLMSKGDTLVFLDSDVMLNPQALSIYKDLSQANPNAIIIGRYDWMQPMDIGVHDVYANWDKIVGQKLPKLKTHDLDGIVGDDPRAERIDFDNKTLNGNFFLNMYGGNLLINKKLFLTIGGFDEHMVGHGGEDCELAIRLQNAGYKAIYSDMVTGYHIYHGRNVKKNMKEVRANVQYINGKHNLNKLGVKIGNIEKGELPLIPR